MSNLCPQIADFLNKSNLPKALRYYVTNMLNTDELESIINEYGINVKNCVNIMIKVLLEKHSSYKDNQIINKYFIDNKITQAEINKLGMDIELENKQNQPNQQNNAKLNHEEYKISLKENQEKEKGLMEGLSSFFTFSDIPQIPQRKQQQFSNNYSNTFNGFSQYLINQEINYTQEIKKNQQSGVGREKNELKNQIKDYQNAQNEKEKIKINKRKSKYQEKQVAKQNFQIDFDEQNLIDISRDFFNDTEANTIFEALNDGKIIILALNSQLIYKKNSFYFLQKGEDLALPPDPKMSFLVQILKNQKKAFKKPQLNKIKMELMYGLNMQHLWNNYIKQTESYEMILQYLPDFNDQCKATYPEREFFYNIINTVNPDLLEKVIKKWREDRQKKYNEKHNIQQKFNINPQFLKTIIEFQKKKQELQSQFPVFEKSKYNQNQQSGFKGQLKFLLSDKSKDNIKLKFQKKQFQLLNL